MPPLREGGDGGGRNIMKKQPTFVHLMAATIIAPVLAGVIMLSVTKYFNAPDQAMAAVESIETQQSKDEAQENLLCNDFVDLSSRVDQNIQNIASAVHAPVVIGPKDINNLCE